MVKTVGQPSDDRWIQATRDEFGITHAEPVTKKADVGGLVPSPPSGKVQEEVVFTVSKRSIPSQQVWRSENVFGRIVNFFEQSVLVLGKVWPKRSPKVDQRLMASLHGQRIAADYPGIKAAPLSQVLKYTIAFLQTQKKETAPPPEVLKTLKQCAKWSKKLDHIATLANYKKRDLRLASLSKELSKTIKDLPPGKPCVIPGGWKQGTGLADLSRVHPALYEITKNPSGTYQFKILSRDPTVNPQSVLVSAGKLKIMPETTFNDLTQAEISDPDWLHAVLRLQMPGGEKVRAGRGERATGTLGKGETTPDFSSMSGLFLPFADRIDVSPQPIEKFRKGINQDVQSKNIWMLVDILGAEFKGPSVPGERRKLQFKVNSLFQFFQATQKDLVNNKTNQILLEEGVQNVGKTASLLFAQGKLTEVEMAVIQRELDIIERTVVKAQKIKQKTSGKKLFKLRSGLKGSVFKKTKMELTPLKSKWVANLAKTADAEESTRGVNAAPLSSLQAQVSVSASLPIPKLNTANVQTVMKTIFSECEGLAKEGKELELQKRIVDFLYEIQLPEATTTRKYPGPDSLYIYKDKGDVHWQNLSPKEIKECELLLGEISRLLGESVERAGNTNPEKLFLLVKVGFFQEYLARLNPNESGLKKNHVLKFWSQIVHDTIGDQSACSEYDLTVPVRLRAYSEREANLQSELKHYQFMAENFLRGSQKKLVNRYKVSYELPNDRTVEVETVSSQRPSGLLEKKAKQSEQLKSMEKQMELFQRLFPFQILDNEKISDKNAKEFCDSWNRKFEHPLLLKAVRNCEFSQRYDGFNEQRIRDDPKEVFQIFDDLASLFAKVDAEQLPNISKEDLSDLFLVLGDSSLWEMMGLIKQKPFLLEFSSVRSLLEQRTFGSKNLLNQLNADYEYDYFALPQKPLAFHLAKWIKEQVPLYKQQGKFHETLFLTNLAHTLTTMAPSLPKEHADYFDFPDYSVDVRSWAYTSLDPSKPEYQFRHTLWTSLLLSLENKEQLTGEQISDLLKGFVILETSPAEMYEWDPLQQVRIRDLREKWKKPIADFISQPHNTQLANHILDTACQIAGIQLPNEPWTGNFPLYKAGDCQVDLLTGNIKTTKDAWFSRGIPIPLREATKAVFEKGELEQASAKFAFKDGRDLFQFQDKQGRTNLIVSAEKGKANVYKQIEVPVKSGMKNLWLQSVAKEDVFVLGRATAQERESSGIGHLTNAMKAAKKAKNAPRLPVFLDNPDYKFWVDPKKSSNVYVLDKKGTPCFNVIIKKRLKGGTVIKGVVDLREGPESGFKVKEVGEMTSKMHPIWQQLTALDSPRNITVWKEGSKITKVELPRYNNLSFEEREGKVVCKHPRLNGWILDTAPASLKKGIQNAVVLRHPTNESQYRMILPELDIVPADPLKQLGFKLIFQAFVSSMKGRLLALDSKDPVKTSWEFVEGESGDQPFWIFDIDPSTSALQEMSNQSVAPYLYLARTHHLNHQPERALESILQMRHVSKKWDEEDLASLNKFLGLPVASPDGFALQLHAALLAQKIAPRPENQQFEQKVSAIYRLYLGEISKVSGVLRISPEDELFCLRALSKYAPEFFEANAPLLAQRKGESRKMKAMQIQKPYFSARPELKAKIDKFTSDLHNALRRDPESSSWQFLSRNISQLGSHFVEIYNIATLESTESQKFKELDLTLRALPEETGGATTSEGEVREFDTVLKNYLVRVLDIRKEGTHIPFPSVPILIKEDLDGGGYTTNRQNLNQFLQEFEKVVTDAVAARPKFVEKEQIALQEFDVAIFEKDLEKAMIALKTNHPEMLYDEMELGDLEGALQARQPKPGMIQIDATVGQALYSKEDLKKYFSVSAVKPNVPQLDLSDLKASSEPALQASAQVLEEEMKIAKESIESTPSMELLKGEKSRAALEKDLFSKKKEWGAKQEKARSDLLKLIQEKSSPAYELQRMGRLVKNVDIDLLLKHFLQDDLEGLSENLPQGVSLEELKTNLGNYLLYSTEVQRFDLALQEVKALHAKKEGLSPILMNSLYHTLTAERQYDPQKNPQLLIFEYMTGLLLRDRQLKMVQDFLQNPNCVRQAATGVGKTTVILVLLALMKADGSNLVTVNFPKQLFEENLNDLKGKLGKIYQRDIHPLQFNMSTPTVTKKGESLFEVMYEDLIRVSLSKGIVISTIESQQALEQKWIRMMDQQSKMSPDMIDPMEEKNLKYLTKIILFMRERQETILDEFDKALTPREERHLKVGSTSKIPEHILKTCLDVYEFLLADPELRLRQNMQGKDFLTDDQRTVIERRVAGKVADLWANQKGMTPTQKQQFLSYILGESEDFLGTIDHWLPEDKDSVAILKDQFFTYLHLTLSKTGHVRYMRSKDGEHTVPCLASDIPRESSEFDQLLEKLNYTMQDYYQTGIRESFLNEWIVSKKRIAEAAVMNGAYESIDDTPEAQVFADYFPGHKLGLLLKSQIPDLVAEVNQDPKRIRRFLELALRKIEISTGKVSCDGHNFVSMSKHTLGASATLGELHALPAAIQTEGAEDKGATGKMVMAILMKSRNPDGTLPPMREYDPASPKQIIPEALANDSDIQVVIDGSGVAAFHGVPFGLPSKQLLDNQPAASKIKGIVLGGEGNRQQVQRRRDIVGLDAAGLKPSELGGFFDESRARGADFKMAPGARALITANYEQLFEAALQTAGRLRRPDQKIGYTKPKGDPLRDAGDLIKTSLKNSVVELGSDNIYRAKKKELRDILRTEMITDLLLQAKQHGIEAMLNRYQQFEPQNILITQKKTDLSIPGTYFAANAAINRMDKDPKDELEDLRNKYADIAQAVDLPQAVVHLNAVTYSPDLLMRLPKKVVGGVGLELDQEVEVETETETETEVEVEVELEVEKEADTSNEERKYDKWLRCSDPDFKVHDLDQIHPAFGAEDIRYTENFFPLYQNSVKNPAKERVRKPHDDIQNPIHYIAFGIYGSGNDARIQGGAVLIDSMEFTKADAMFADELFVKYQGIRQNIYDTRQKKFVKGPLAEPGVAIPDTIKPRLNKILAMTGFFDGKCDQYSTEELDALRAWLAPLDLKEMETYFTSQILKYKPEKQQSYPFSPLCKLFKELRGD